MARLPYPDARSVPPEVTELFGDPESQPPLRMLAHSAALVRPFLLTGRAQFTALRLPLRTRELIILTVAALTDCDYEYIQHIPISEAAGISPELREAIRRTDFDATALNAGDRVLTEFVAELVRRPRVSDRTFNAARALLSDQEIVEVHQLVGFYWSFARLCTNLDIEVVVPDGLSSMRAVIGMDPPPAPAARPGTDPPGTPPSPS